MENVLITAKLAELMAGYGAMRQMLTTLIATHPNPERVRSHWHARRLDRVDAEAEQPFFAVPDYREAYLDLLQGLSQEVDRAAEAH